MLESKFGFAIQNAKLRCSSFSKKMVLHLYALDSTWKTKELAERIIKTLEFITKHKTAYIMQKEVGIDNNFTIKLTVIDRVEILPFSYAGKSRTLFSNI